MSKFVPEEVPRANVVGNLEGAAVWTQKRGRQGIRVLQYPAEKEEEAESRKEEEEYDDEDVQKELGRDDEEDTWDWKLEQNDKSLLGSRQDCEAQRDPVRDRPRRSRPRFEH